MLAWWLFGASLVVIVLLMRQRYRPTKARASELLPPNQEQVVAAQRLYLETLRRELSQLIMNLSIETFEKAFYNMTEFEREMTNSRKERRRAEQTQLLHKFPNFESFDLVGTRHYVSYDTAMQYNDCEELVERYKEISKFLVLGRFETEPPSSPVYDEIEGFKEYVQIAKDKRLRQEIDEAMKRYRVRQSGLILTDKEHDDYEDTEYCVTYLTHNFENQYGVFSKTLNERGIYSSYVFEDSHGTTKITYSYYRSDEGFQNERPLQK